MTNKLYIIQYYDYQYGYVGFDTHNTLFFCILNINNLIIRTVDIDMRIIYNGKIIYRIQSRNNLIKGL